jgi:hypothetical protein
MDMNVSALAMAYSANPELAAFRYMYAGFRRHARDQRFTSSERRQMFEQIRQRLRILPPHLHADATAAVRDKDRPYWFAPEWSGPSAVIEQFGSKELAWTYLQTSATAHGTLLGMRLYREQPDKISINPETPGTRALYLDFASCRFLITIVEIRDALEGLGLAARTRKLVNQLSAAAMGPPPQRGTAAV